VASANSWAFYERHFAHARLQHYLSHTGGDQSAAMELYRWNVAISGAFWQSLAYFEVALRNALDERMGTRHSASGRQGHWVFDDARELGRDAEGPGHHRQPYKDIAEGIRRVRRNHKPLSAGQIISEVPFGFWHQLISRRQMFLWPDLAGAFPHRTEPQPTHNPTPGGATARVPESARASSPGVVGERPGSLRRPAAGRRLHRPRPQELHRSAQPGTKSAHETALNDGALRTRQQRGPRWKDGRMTDDHLVGSGVISDPVGLARAIVKRPGMYMGCPVTFSRATAYILGVEMALLVGGTDSPLTEEDHRWLQACADGDRSEEDERDDIRRLETLLTKLFIARSTQYPVTSGKANATRHTRQDGM